MKNPQYLQDSMSSKNPENNSMTYSKLDFDIKILEIRNQRMKHSILEIENRLSDFQFKLEKNLKCIPSSQISKSIEDRRNQVRIITY